MPIARTAVECFDHRKRWLLESRLARSGVLWGDGRRRGPMSGLECLQRLWAHLDGLRRKDGRLDDLGPEDVEAIAGWPGEPGALWRELIATGWVDQVPDGFACHDFGAVNERAIRARENGALGGRPHSGGEPSPEPSGEPSPEPRTAARVPELETQPGTQDESQPATQGTPSPLPPLTLPPLSAPLRVPVPVPGSGSDPGVSSSDAVAPDLPKRRRGPPPSPEAVRLAGALRDAIVRHTPSFRAPAALDGWARDLDLALRIDHRTTADVARAIRFAHVDPAGSFWRPNVLSGATLRRQLDRLLMQADRAARDPRGAGLGARDLEGLEASLRERGA